jgi:lysophospholipase L1-like esterase
MELGRALLLIAAISVSVTPARAEQTLSFTSGASVSDLLCPNAPVKPPGPPHVAEPEGGTEIPNAAELGALAVSRTNPQPRLDPKAIPEFRLGRPRRFAVWGDSHSAAGPFMPTLQAALASLGSVGPHFVPPTMGRANVRLPALHAYCIGGGWSTDLAYKAKETVAVGPGLANRVAAAGVESYLWLDWRTAERKANVKDLHIVYRPGAETTLAISVNDGPETMAVLPAGTERSAALALDGDGDVATLKLRVVSGALTLQGFTVDYDQEPLVVFDVFGIPSSTAAGWANAEPQTIAAALGGERYDGVVLEYGTNEGSDPKFDPAKYRDGLSAALANMRKVFPSASCVLVGPPDRGVLLPKTRGPHDVLLYSRIHQTIARIQAETGAQFGCAAWNWQDLMGGSGGAYGWAHNTPPLMGPDLTHLTGTGYKRTGEALAKSLGWEAGDAALFPP